MPFGYSKFAQDAQVIRNSLVLLDALILDDRFREHAKISKAMTLVWMAAVVEEFWKQYLSELCVRVGGASLRKRRKHLASASIYYFDVLGSMGEGKKLKRWGRVVEFFEKISVTGGVVAPTLPYDGRTVGPEHFDLVWKLFQLPGQIFPSPIHRQELNTLATRRNDVAHGNLTPQAVGGAVSVGDLMRIISRIEDIVENSVVCATKQWP